MIKLNVFLLMLFGFGAKAVQGQVCATVGTTPTSLKGYGLSSSYIQVYDWMRSPCNGPVLSVTFVSIGLSNITLRFYLATFDNFTVTNQATYYALLNYIPIDVPPVADGTLPRTIPINSGSLNVVKGNVFGIFYDSWNFTQSQMVIPYQPNLVGNANPYSTFVGPIAIQELQKINRLRVGAELSYFPNSRLFAISVDVGNSETTAAAPTTVSARRLFGANCGRVAPIIANAYVNFQSWTDVAYIGDTVEYKCVPNYRMKIGSYYRVTCQEPLVQWSMYPECIWDNSTTTAPATTTTPIPTTRPAPVIFCSKSPGNIVNGLEDRRSFNGESIVGQVITYRCLSGYDIVGPHGADVICRPDGTWTPMPYCTERRPPCDTPPNVLNAYLFNQTQALGTIPVEGDIMIYLCNRGYHSSEISGQTLTLVCKAGLWSNRAPACLPDFVYPQSQNYPKVQTCGEPPKISTAVEKARSWRSNDFSIPGDYALYDCKSGYTMAGSGQAGCMGDLSWGVQFECRQDVANSTRSGVDCGVPLTIDSASEQFRRFANPSSSVGRVGDSVYYQCNSGYTMNGSPGVFCLADLTWSVLFRCDRARN